MHRATPLMTSFRAYTSGGARSCIDKADDAKLMQEMGGNFMKGETRSKVESPQNYGFTSVVMDADKDKDGKVTGSAEGFISFCGGNRSFPVCGVMDDRRHRLQGLDKGDVAMFRTKDDQQQFHLTQAGGYWSAPDDKTTRMQLVAKNQQQQSSGSKGQKGQKSVYKDGNDSTLYVDVTKDRTRVSGARASLMLPDKKGYVDCTGDDKQVWVGMERGNGKSSQEMLLCGEHRCRGVNSSRRDVGAAHRAARTVRRVVSVAGESLMRFDINRPNSYMFVDDIIQDLDASDLPADVVRVRWLSTEGWIKYASKTLETPITDASPYQIYLNRWTTARLTAAPPPTLAEAQQIKTVLIAQLYDLKRQAPFFASTSAGAFNWEANDGAMANMATAMIPSIIAAIGSVGSGSSSLISQLNANYNTWRSQLNNNFAGGNATGNSVIGFVNNTMLGVQDGGNTINGRLVIGGDGSAPPGLVSPGIAHDGDSYAFAPVSALSVSGAGSGSMNLSWTPIGQAAPVTLSSADVSTIMTGIANRRTNLLTTKVNKTNAVNALTSIAGVIAYDATAGW
jgi:phage gp45-like